MGPSVEKVIFPPPTRGLFCVVCFTQSTDVQRFPVEYLTQTTFELPHVLHPLASQVGNCRALCKSCRELVESEGEWALRERMAFRLMESGIKPTLRCSAFRVRDGHQRSSVVLDGRHARRADERASPLGVSCAAVSARSGSAVDCGTRVRKWRVCSPERI